MTDLRALSSQIAKRSGHAATAVALILTASAAFAEGNKSEGRSLVEQALTVQARVYDEPQEDTVLTAKEREQLREIANGMREEYRHNRDFMRAAAVDLISSAGMVSRRRADADASLRMVLAFNQEVLPSEEEKKSVFRDMGLPLVIGNGRKNTMKFDFI